MRNRKMPAWLILAIPAVIICLLLLLVVSYLIGSSRLIRDVRYRELDQDKIRPTLMRISGRQLPGKVQDLRAISRDFSGVENILVSFKTDQEGCSHVLDEFGGQDALKQEFPDEKRAGRILSSAFTRNVCRLQRDVGIVVFDEELLARLDRDYMERLRTDRFPEDAIAGWHLKGGRSGSLCSHTVLIFKEQKFVYISAARRRPGSYQR